MSMQRTNVYAEASDLALIKQAATRTGESEAEIIRRGIHIAALSTRTWDTPFLSQEEGDELDLGFSLSADTKDAAADATQEKLERLENNR